eukprot:1545355-Rhodomonas_salina.1
MRGGGSSSEGRNEGCSRLFETGHISTIFEHLRCSDAVSLNLPLPRRETEVGCRISSHQSVPPPRVEVRGPVGFHNLFSHLADEKRQAE